MKEKYDGIYDSRDLLRLLLNEYKVPLETFIIAVKGKKDDIENFLSNDISVNHKQAAHLANIIALIHSITFVDNDERIVAITKALRDDFFIPFESIALLCEIELPVIEQFMQSPDSVSNDIKYRIAVVVLFLQFTLCKTPYS